MTDRDWRTESEDTPLPSGWWVSWFVVAAICVGLIVLGFALR